MNRFLLLVLIAGATFLLILFAVRPDLISNIWLWFVGLAGVIVKLFQWLTGYFKKLLNPPQDNKSVIAGTSVTETKHQETVTENDTFEGVTLYLLRYYDDGKTTVGLLLVNHKFYCYTLEDTYHKQKIAGETRIPAGTYAIRFRKEETPFTKTMRQRYPEWFTWHLQLQEVPGFDSIYIHNGGDHTDTEGCILVSDRLTIGEGNTTLTHSRETFKRLYRWLSEKLYDNIPVRIVVKDENWMNNLK